jgi:hypothetical protein
MPNIRGSGHRCPFSSAVVKTGAHHGKRQRAAPGRNKHALPGHHMGCVAGGCACCRERSSPCRERDEASAAHGMQVCTLPLRPPDCAMKPSPLSPARPSASASSRSSSTCRACRCSERSSRHQTGPPLTAVTDNVSCDCHAAWPLPHLCEGQVGCIRQGSPGQQAAGQRQDLLSLRGQG